MRVFPGSLTGEGRPNQIGTEPPHRLGSQNLTKGTGVNPSLLPAFRCDVARCFSILVHLAIPAIRPAPPEGARMDLPNLKELSSSISSHVKEERTNTASRVDSEVCSFTVLCSGTLEAFKGGQLTPAGCASHTHPWTSQQICLTCSEQQDVPM